MTDIWEDHPLLFHYTNQAGIKGILQTQTLHATHYKFLNDAQEIKQLLPRLKQQLSPSLQKAIAKMAQHNKDLSQHLKQMGGMKKAADHEADIVAKSLYEATFSMKSVPNFYEPFVASFCSHKDIYEMKNGLLSQWRAYGGQDGYAVVIDTLKFCDLIKLEATRYSYNLAHVSTVVYDDDEVEFAKEFSELILELEKIAPQIYAEQFPDFSSLFGPFINCATRFKHRGFSEEREIRVVLPPISKFWIEKLRIDQPEDFKNKIGERKDKEINYKDNLSPFIAIGHPDNKDLPIQYIIVGPSRNKESRAEKIKKYLELRGLAIEVKISDTPLI